MQKYGCRIKYNIAGEICKNINFILQVKIHRNIWKIDENRCKYVEICGKYVELCIKQVEKYVEIRTDMLENKLF